MPPGTHPPRKNYLHVSRIVKDQPIWNFTKKPEDRRATRTCLLPSRNAGGANRDRTGDLLLAKQALSQLSYGPV